MNQKHYTVIPSPNKQVEDCYLLPLNEVPSFRVWDACEKKVAHNLLFSTWGGIGDQICAEPTIRYAIKNFKQEKISLLSKYSELYSHLKFDHIYSSEQEVPWSNYLHLRTAVPSEDFTAEFFSHMLTNCIDFPAICALRMQLPTPQDKQILLTGKEPSGSAADELNRLSKPPILVHPGKHWATKTFPKEWWDEVLYWLRTETTPVIIGGTISDRTTVDVDTDNCIDMRGKLSVQETVWLCQHAAVLLTNDSSPLHMAASDDAKDVSSMPWIGFIATAKRPEYIMHWRAGHFGYREQNFSSGGLWDIQNYCPNQTGTIMADKIDEKTLLSWLPRPRDYAQWALGKVR